MNLPDGITGVIVGRIKGANKIKPCYGADLFKETLTATSNTNIKHFLCCGKEGMVAELKRICEDEYENKNIMGTYSLL